MTKQYLLTNSFPSSEEVVRAFRDKFKNFIFEVIKKGIYSSTDDDIFMVKKLEELIGEHFQFRSDLKHFYDWIGLNVDFRTGPYLVDGKNVTTWSEFFSVFKEENEAKNIYDHVCNGLFQIEVQTEI